MTASDALPDELADLLLGRGFVVVPLHINAVGHFELATEVNGHPARLVLDTGASRTVFATESAERFGLATAASTDRASDVGASDHASQTVIVSDLRLGAARLRDLEARAFDFGHVNRALEARGGTPVDGALGADVLRSAEAVIDYARARLYLLEDMTHR